MATMATKETNMDQYHSPECQDYQKSGAQAESVKGKICIEQFYL